jgi:hypothetical protein
LTFPLGKRPLRGFFFAIFLVEVEFALECISKLGQVLVAGNPVHSQLSLQWAESKPPGSLLRMMPALDSPNVILNQAVEVLDRVGGLEGSAYLVENPESMKRKGLFEAFLKGTSCRSVDLLKLSVEVAQGRACLLICGVLVGMP